MKQLIEKAFEERNELDPAFAENEVRPAVEAALTALERGEARVAEPLPDGGWQVNEWLKKAVLLYFKLSDNQPIPGGHTWIRPAVSPEQ